MRAAARVEPRPEQMVMHADITRVASAAQRFDVRYLGRAVCWRVWGNGGPPLVLLHGGHGNWMHWVRNIEALAERHAVWVPDMPGFGDSEELAGAPHDPARQERLLDALGATLDTLIGWRAVTDLAGFSFGGLVATELAARRGQVRRLALLGPAGHGGKRRETAALLDWRSDDPVHRRNGLLQNLNAFMLHLPTDADSVAFAAHEEACLQTRFRSKAISRAAGLTNALARIETPTLFIWGAHDVTAVPHEIAPRVADESLAREWCVVPGAGHWVQYEGAAEVNGMLCRWFHGGEGDRA